ncbi:RNA polymerase sigma-70 factor, ECF subfamily [Parapedobacter luteus]|uniref:RNA polymerase sigma-70 factor, ECF subfamily n=1 Tax=Parapedobacter luteus TaxID=623280 RepID=A0A1T5C5E9_9SPHI|nr:RNA polymerase sigma-70 factor [Parapedobacter luteus]SKB54654.1 RNA polymerase sigma-70 factor, ECF subfamily [Parapedobacter luteus]
MTYTEQSDLDLIAALRNDDSRALAELYNRYWERLLLISLAKLKAPEVVEEIVNDVFFDLWKSRHRLVIKTSLAHYLFAIAKYKIFAHLAKAKKSPSILQLETLELEQTGVAAPDRASDLIRFKECQQRIEHAVAALPDKCQLVFKLSREDGFSIQQIARHLRVSPKTVEGHLSNALRKLRVSLSHLVSLFIIFIR